MPEVSLSETGKVVESTYSSPAETARSLRKLLISMLINVPVPIYITHVKLSVCRGLCSKWRGMWYDICHCAGKAGK